ncbi:MAG: acyl-CoA dehydrogenase family protein [Pseudomonas sp.]
MNAGRVCVRAACDPEAPEFIALLRALSEEFAATAADYDRHAAFPHANLARLHATGLLALTVPRALGGAGASLERARQVVQAVARGEPSTALVLTMQYLIHRRLQVHPRWPPALRRRLAQEAVRDGALVNALRVEPELGTPARGGLPATLACRDDGHWRISGRKLYSTGIPGLTWLNVWARSDDPVPQVGYWLVHRDTPGIHVVESWDHLGMRASCSHTVVLEDVRVPLAHAVDVRSVDAPPEPDDAEDMLWMVVLLATIYDAVAGAARDWFAGWLQRRAPSNLGSALATLPRFEQLLGRIDALLLSNRVLLDCAAQGRLQVSEAGLLKHLVTRQAIEAVELAVEAAGNPGLDCANPLQRHYRDVLCARIHAPQDDMLLGGAGRAAFARLAAMAGEGVDGN